MFHPKESKNPSRILDNEISNLLYSFPRMTAKLLPDFPIKKQKPRFSAEALFFSCFYLFMEAANRRPSSFAFFRSSSVGTNATRKGSSNTAILRFSSRDLMFPNASPLQP